jgi:hypothetical protein
VSNHSEMVTAVRTISALAILSLLVQVPAPVTLAIRIAGDRRQFRPGEIIPLELEFNSVVPKRFVVDGATYDRSGRLTIDEFRIEPNDGVSDPMLDYFASTGGAMGGGIRGIGVLGEKPHIVKLELNDWFRFDEPGTYRISVRSQRVTDEAGSNRSVVPVESNTASFEILPRDPEWEAVEVGAALQILDATATSVDRRKGCRMLRFLANDAAVEEMIRRYDDGESGCNFEYMAGLAGAPNRARAVRQMEAGLRVPDQPITQSYLRTLAMLSVYVQHPEFRPPQNRDTKGRMGPGELSRHPELVQAAEAMYTDILTAALPEKTDRARAVTLAGRVSAQRRDSTTPDPAASRDDLRAQLTATFLDLPTDRQISLLGYSWPSIANAGMRPILRRLAEKPAPASPSLQDLALRRLYELAPEEGRALIVREIRNPSAGGSLRTLGMLPDRELPELDDVLAANIDIDQDHDALSIRAELLQRYASPATAARVLATIEGILPLLACRPKAAFLAYFARVDPPLGKTMLDAALASRETTGCYRIVLNDVARLRMSPVVEAVAIASLDDPVPEVVSSAAEMLGRFGSAAAREPLRARFERWHQAWDGRQEELRYRTTQDRANAAQGMLEGTLFQALARGQAWLADERDLRELRSLCVTDNCRTQADYITTAADDTRITIVRVEEPADSLVMLAQYQLNSIAALEQKLTQYPKGTRFTLDVQSLDSRLSSRVVAELAAFADAKGITLRR